MEIYYENGKVFTTRRYIKNLLNGDYKAYYENGNLYIVGKYIDNYKIGPGHTTPMVKLASMKVMEKVLMLGMVQRVKIKLVNGIVIMKMVNYILLAITIIIRKQDHGSILEKKGI